MVEVELKLGLSDYANLLSDWLESKGKKFLINMLKILRILFQYAKKQFVFFRHFQYTKENIQRHLMTKAAQFFGIELGEKQRKFKRHNKPFKHKSRLKGKKFVLYSEAQLVKETPSWRKKPKNNRKNLYHPTE
jgi:hypothetical protein